MAFKDDIVYKIILIMKMLNFENFYLHYNIRGDGQSFFKPQILYAIHIYSNFRRIFSSRVTEYSCYTDIGFRLVSGGTQPDHSTLCRFRKKFSKEIQDLNKQFSWLLIELQITEVRDVSIDGTKISSNAALSSNKSAKAIERELNAFTEECVLEDEKENDADNSQLTAGMKNLGNSDIRRNNLEKAQEILNEKHEEAVEEYNDKMSKREEIEATTGMKIRGRKLKDPGDTPDPKLKVNVTDPDSSIMYTAKKYHIQGYNVQLAVNDEQFILVSDVTSEQNDVNQLLPMVDSVIELCESANTNLPSGFVLDAGYHSYQNLVGYYSKYSDIDILIPVKKEHKIEAIPDSNRPILQIQDMIMYLIKVGYFNNSTPILASTGAYIFETWLNDEDSYPTKESILAQFSDAKVSSPSGRKRFSPRKYTVEPVNAHIKFNMGMYRFVTRSLETVRAELSLAAMIYNIKKVIKLGRFGKLTSSLHQNGSSMAFFASLFTILNMGVTDFGRVIIDQLFKSQRSYQF